VTRIAILALSVICVLLAGCGGGGKSSSAEGCEHVDAPAPKADGGAKQPAGSLDASKTYVLVVETNCGDFEITLDQKLAPHTSASLVSLAQQGFFDDTTFHRVVPGFVIQGGDPTGQGGGGPGYSTTDPPPSGTKYTRGVVAMAKTATEPAGTSGSQFFVVTAEDAGLPPDYAVVGKVTKGYDTVERIDALGTATEEPSEPVVMKRVTVRES
jgi:peptidyl-prolyl cis-trans isomerase B (cyclophilin B)